MPFDHKGGTPYKDPPVELSATLGEVTHIQEIAKVTGIRLRTLWGIIKIWQDSGEPSTSQKKRGRKKNLSS